MLFVRLYDESLAQASYLIGCAASGTAIVIDPNRQVEQYIAAAEARGLRIAAVTETHIHADFVSGSRELAARTGARLYLSGAGPAEWQYGYRTDPNVVLLGDGDTIRLGEVELRAVHTPGHTPEHLSFLVTDTAVAPEPVGIVTGDFVFAGDVGRPDLLEKTARVAGSAASGARQLFTSLTWFKTLPDHLQIWPGHGAGSACGKGLSAMPQSTVGYERRFNWALGISDADAFVREALEGQPEPPRYFGEMKQVNRVGPRVQGRQSAPERLPDQRLDELLARGAVLVDTRPAGEFAGGHVPGTLSIPFNNSFPTWAGSLLPYDHDLYLIVDAGNPDLLERIVASLSMIGIDAVRGWFPTESLDAWRGRGGTPQRVEQLPVDRLAGKTGPMVLDVRGKSEWDEGHIPGATHIPLAELLDRIGELPKGEPIAVHCQGGGRSSIAASLLQARGFDRVTNLSGGFGAWSLAGLPVERDGNPPAGR